MERTTSRQVAGIQELVAEVAALRGDLLRLDERVARLEALAASPAQAGSAGDAEDRDEEAVEAIVAAPGGLAGALPTELMHAGRLLLVLAGAFLLRAATEGGRLPRPLGVALGLAYALAWLAAALRSGRRGDDAGAAFHAASTLAIACPLVWEATTRFAILTPAAGTLAFAGVIAAAFAVAWRQRTAAAAWLVVGSAAATGLALAAGTGRAAPQAAILVGLGAASLALARARGWWAVATAAAAAADLAVASLTGIAILAPAGVPARVALPVQLALLLVHPLAAMALARAGEPLRRSLLVQVAAAVVVGGGGALLLAGRAGGVPAAVTGALFVLLGASAEATALRVAAAGDRAAGRLFLAAATALLLGGTALLLPLPALAWAVLAVGLAIGGVRTAAPGVPLQAALVAAAALAGSGAASRATAALLLATAAPAPWPLAAVVAPLAAAGCLLALARSPAHREPPRAAEALLLALLAWIGSGAVSDGVTALLPGLAADPGLRAATATWVLAAAGALLARLGRLPRLAVASRLVYPWLLAMAVQLLAVDLPHGRPLTLFLALAALGAALLGAASAARAGRPAQAA